MNDAEIEILLRSCNPVPDGNRAFELTGSAPIAELRQTIVESSEVETVRPTASSPTRFAPRRVYRAALVAGIALLALTLTLARQESGGEVSATPLAVARAAPRFVSESWPIVGVGRFTPESGEVEFSDGAFAATLYWMPAEAFADVLTERKSAAYSAHTVTLNGTEMAVLDYGSEFRVLFVHDDDGVEIVAPAIGEVDMTRFLRSLTEVSPEEWLDSLPSDVLRPAVLVHELSEILTGVPLPDSLPQSSILDADFVGNRTQYAGQVVAKVVCEWSHHWFDATAADPIARQDAETALATIRDWPIIQELLADSASGFIPVVVSVADGIAFGEPVIYGGGPGPVTRDYVDGAIGCLAP